MPTRRRGLSRCPQPVLFPIVGAPLPLRRKNDEVRENSPPSPCSRGSAGFSAPVFSAPPPGAFLRDDGNYWMHGPHTTTSSVRRRPSRRRSPSTSASRRRRPAAKSSRSTVPATSGLRATGTIATTAITGWRAAGCASGPGYYYSSPTWVQRGDRWHADRGGWERGVSRPQRRLARSRPRRHPEPLRPRPRQRRHAATADRDRDGDGVRNQPRQPSGQPASSLTRSRPGPGQKPEPGVARKASSSAVELAAEDVVAVREAAEALDHRAMPVRVVEHRRQLAALAPPAA